MKKERNYTVIVELNNATESQIKIRCEATYNIPELATSSAARLKIS